jgi:hypothetical protein
MTFMTLPIPIYRVKCSLDEDDDIQFDHIQIGANIILLIMTNLMGLVSFYLSDKKQRRAFIDTRQSLEMKLVIEEQAREQVSLDKYS